MSVVISLLEKVVVNYHDDDHLRPKNYSSQILVEENERKYHLVSRSVCR